MNLLVTGGAGFIGSNLIEQIIGRPEVRRLVNLDCLTYAGHLGGLRAVASDPRYTFERVDLRDPAAVSGVVQRHAITHVLHLASESHVDRSIRGPADFIATNIVGTFNLLEACREAWRGVAEGRRFHHVSTDEVYGSLGPTGHFLESTAYAPNSPYSASKASSNLLVRAYHRTYGLPVVTTNCSNNYGPRQFPEKLIPVVIRNLLTRQPIPVYGDGLHIRDWIFVRDHCEALWRVLTHGRDGEVYNIGGCNERPNLRLVEELCDRFDALRPEMGGQSRRLISLVPDRPGHDRRYAVDAGKLQRELGWAPAFTLEQGIQETLKWYLDNPEWLTGTPSEAAAGSPRDGGSAPSRD